MPRAKSLSASIDPANWNGLPALCEADGEAAVRAGRLATPNQCAPLSLLGPRVHVPVLVPGACTWCWYLVLAPIDNDRQFLGESAFVMTLLVSVPRIATRPVFIMRP